MHRFWDCSVSGCPKAAAIDIGGCERCRSMYCAGHIRSAFHKCEDEPLDDDEWTASQTAELEALRQKTNHSALLQRAKDLSGGLQCWIEDSDPLGRAHMGGMHIHLQIHFDDGTVWLARIPRENYTSFDDDVTNRMIISEYSTLKWLESIDIPTPKAHGYGLRNSSDNKVGVTYLLMEKLPGQPFDSGMATKEQKTKVLDQWAKHLGILGQHPFAKVGCLTIDADANIEVGPIVGDRTGTLPCIGPFETSGAYYSAWARMYLDLIADRQLLSEYATDAYLMFKTMVDRVETGSWLNRWEKANHGPFYLKHMDDKGDHILVDENFQITGIIDWTFARTVPPYEAFGPSLVSADNDCLFSGKPGLSDNDLALDKALQSQGVSLSHFKSDEMRRYLFGLGMGLGLTREEAWDVFRAIVITFEGDDSVQTDLQEWRQARLADWTFDDKLSALKKAEDSCTMLPNEGFGVPRFATCSNQSCSRPSVRGSSCSFCKRHLCAIHALPKHHRCPSSSSIDDETWEANINHEVELLLAEINVPELVRVASNLRHGISCRFQPGKHLGSGAIMGCANYHGWLVFDDGIKWLARIPRTTDFSDVPPSLVEYLVKSEYATLKWLEDRKLPAPKAHGVGVASDPRNSVGVSYILEDAVPGKPYYSHLATDAQKTQVYTQYRSILAQLFEHPCAQVCSLVLSDSRIQEGPVASNRFLSLGQYGPFSTSLEYFTAVAKLHLDLIADGQLHTEFALEAFIFYRLLLDRAAPVLAKSSDTTEKFYLKHVDDKGDHILIDDDYNITGIIDWQFARFVPECEAYGPSLFTAELGDLYSATAGLSDNDRLLASCFQKAGQTDLAKLCGGSELARRFQLGLASGLLREEVVGMTRAVLLLVGDDVPSDRMEEWFRLRSAELAGDSKFEKVKRLAAELGEEQMEEA